MLLLHGLMQSTGAFCVNDENSLAFFLCKSGYDVWLGNNRGYFKPQHKSLKPSNPKFWAWNLRQMGCLDLSALVSHVCAETGRKKVTPRNPAIHLLFSSILFKQYLTADWVDSALTRNGIDFHGPSKRPSPPSRRILIMFHCPCTSRLRRHPPPKISICLCQNNVHTNVPCILRYSFIYTPYDGNTLHHAWIIIWMARIQGV